MIESWNSTSFRAGGGADDAGGDLHVLLADRRHDVGGGEAARRRPCLRIEPDAHRVVARAEELHVWPTPGMRASTSLTLSTA